MSLLSTPLREIKYEDVIDFLKEGNRESQILDYKKDFSVKGNIAKTVSAFANSFGGTIIIGVVDDGDSYPDIDNSFGINHQRQNHERVTKSCLSNIDPIVIPKVHVAKDHNTDKEFVIIRVPPSLSSPHAFKYGDGKTKLRIYIRTNEDSHEFEREITNDKEFLDLINGRNKAIEFRSLLLERTSNRLNEWFYYEKDSIEDECVVYRHGAVIDTMAILHRPFEGLICPIRLLSIPSFPNKPLCDLDHLLTFNGDRFARVQRSEYCFFNRDNIRLHSDGIMGSKITKDEIYIFDLDEYGTVSLSGSFLKREIQQTFQNLDFVCSYIATCINFIRNYYSHLEYEGPILIKLLAANLTGFELYGNQNKAIEDEIDLQYECYTYDLEEHGGRLKIYDHFVKKFCRNYDVWPDEVDDLFKVEREQVLK